MTLETSAESTSASASRGTVGPGSLMSVWVPRMGSTSLRLVRVSPATSKGPQAIRIDPSCPWIQRPALPASRHSASVSPPSAATTFETLMPLPPASWRSSSMRLTASIEKFGTWAVLSTAGLSVTV